MPFLRNKLNIVCDIEKTSPSSPTKTRLKQPNYHSLNYSDVTKAAWRTQRSSNPLNPTYSRFDEKGVREIIGEIEGAKPRAPLKLTEKNKSTSLYIQDI